MFEFLTYDDLNHIKYLPNEIKWILDLIITDVNLNLDINVPICPISIKSIHHSPLLSEADCVEYFSENLNTVKCYDFINAYFDNYILSVDWKDLFKNHDLQNMYNIFLSNFVDSIDRFIPYKFKRENNHSPWYNKQLINLKNRKTKALKSIAM